MSSQSSTTLNSHSDDLLDADIAGPGVIIGFMLANTLTVISASLLIWLNSRHGILNNEERSKRPYRRRPFDSLDVTSASQLKYGNSPFRSSTFPSLHGPLSTPSVPTFKYTSVVETAIQPRQPSLLGLSPVVWRSLLSEFVLQLSDQQLLTGLLLLVVGVGKYYETAVQKGENNMWTAGDIVIFSSVTHGATMLALQPYLRHHRALATFRFVIMCIILAIWLLIAATILEPQKPTSDDKLPNTWAHFWHGATYIEIFGVFAMYLVTYVPIWIPQHWINVRQSIAQRRTIDYDGLLLSQETNSKSSNPIGRTIKHLLLDFCLAYSYCCSKGSLLKKYLLVALAELVYPWYFSVVIVGILWLFGFSTMVCDLKLSHLLNTWSFGQLLPPCLILLPIYSLVASAIEKRSEG